MSDGKKSWGRPKGSTNSPEHRRKISEGVRAAFERLKAQEKEGAKE